MDATARTSRIRELVLKYAERQVALGSKFGQDEVNNIIARLLDLDKEKCKPIILVIDSNGGNPLEAERLCEAIEKLRSPVFGLVKVKCLSSAFIVLQACEKRLAEKKDGDVVKIALHNNFIIVPLVITADTRPEVITGLVVQETRERSRIRDEIVARLRRKLTWMTKGEIIEFMRERKLMSAEEALQRKFLDEIVEL